MTTLTVTSKGQVTLRKEVLKHLGIGPGDKVNVDLLPDRTITVHAVHPEQTGSIEDFFYCLGPWNGPPASLDELKQAAADGWASAMDYEQDQRHEPNLIPEERNKA